MANPKVEFESAEQRIERINRQVTDSVNAFNRAIDESGIMMTDMAVAFHKQIFLDLARGVITGTPVDTGRARGNWQSSVGSAINNTIDRSDPSGQLSTREAEAASSRITLGSVAYLQNNLEYITYLEDGSSQQAPSGMVALNLERLQGVFR